MWEERHKDIDASSYRGDVTWKQHREESGASPPGQEFMDQSSPTSGHEYPGALALATQNEKDTKNLVGAQD